MKNTAYTSEETVNRGLMILNSLNIVCNGFTNITFGWIPQASTVPSLHACTSTSSGSNTLLGLHTSSVISALLQTCRWHLEKYGIHPCYGFLLIIAFCPPRLQELLTAWAGDYLHSFAAPLHHTMACNVHWGLIFVFSSIFWPAYILQTLFTSLFFSLSFAATRDQH